MPEAAEPPRDSPDTTGPAAVLTLAGVAAAIGVASCCALPVILLGLGIGSVGLAGIAAFAEPHRALLLAASAICLVAGAALALFHRPSARACAVGTRRPRSVARGLIVTGAFFGSVLLVLGYVYV